MVAQEPSGPYNIANFTITVFNGQAGGFSTRHHSDPGGPPSVASPGLLVAV